MVEEGAALPAATIDVNGGSIQRPLAEVCAEVAEKVNSFLESEVEGQVLKDVQAQTRIALGVIEECLERYSLEAISLSYNGGKDCLVLLILLLCALHNHSSSLPPRLQTVYIVSPHPFPEVTSFVESSSQHYSLALSEYNMPMRQAFEQYLEDKEGKVKAILVGTRRTDPHGEKLGFFDETDGLWPRFIRVHPVIDWHYREIWSFIRHLGIPYCPLYDQGYTSLGGTTDTHPNPALKAKATAEMGQEEDDTRVQVFRPAYELVEDEEERLGRDWEKK